MTQLKGTIQTKDGLDFIPYTTADQVYLSDGSNTEDNLNLLESGLAELTGEINNLKQSVSSGKTKVASAITDKGVQTDANSTFDTLAQNIKLIKIPSGNAVAGDVLAGKTFTNSTGNQIAGTMINQGTKNSTLTTQNGEYTIPQGYHSGTGKVKATFANLIAENIASGINIGGVVGTSPKIEFHSAVDSTTSSLTMQARSYEGGTGTYSFNYFQSLSIPEHWTKVLFMHGIANDGISCIMYIDKSLLSSKIPSTMEKRNMLIMTSMRYTGANNSTNIRCFRGDELDVKIDYSVNRARLIGPNNTSYTFIMCGY